MLNRTLSRRCAPKVVNMYKGQTYTMTKKFTGEEVETFGNLTGDRNPVHFSEEAAKAAGFPGRIVHGMLLGSMFSEMMGVHLPGPGTIYMNQSLRFVQPVYLGEELTYSVKMVDHDPATGNIVMETIARKVNGNRLVIKGEAKGRNKNVVVIDPPAEK